MNERIVSIVVPCRNEAAHIDAFVSSALAQQLAAGDELEVVIADGESSDGTREKLAAWQQREPRLRVIDNPQRITSAALNRAVAAARGEVVVRMDVHTEYASDYVAQCLAALRETGAACVGGAWRPVGQGWPQAAIARAFESRFGSGGAASRRVDYTGEVDTVYLGAWWRDALLRLGGFDEALVRNQDDELALRITRGGGRVWQSAAIKSWYTPRASFAALFRQFYQYGYWKVPVIRKHRLPASPRHLVPFAFVATLAILALGGVVWSPARWALGGVVGLYAAAALANALALTRSPRDGLGIAWAFACMHGGYGLGFGRGLLDFALLKRAPGDAATRLTR
ncbi:MAG: glycosyltransferase family 2 protein [Burkholderiales bacterium]|nr:glycosyltransferase family 2 protein [Burkholderiales bacterium]